MESNGTLPFFIFSGRSALTTILLEKVADELSNKGRILRNWEASGTAPAIEEIITEEMKPVAVVGKGESVNDLVPKILRDLLRHGFP